MPLRSYILDNFRWKLAALVLAVLVWFGIKFSMWRGMGDDQARTFLAQPVSVLTAANDGRTFNISPAEVDVFVRGSRGAVNRLEQKGLQVFVNLASVPEIDAVVREVQVSVPGGVTLVRITPPAVSVERITLPDARPANNLREP